MKVNLDAELWQAMKSGSARADLAAMVPWASPHIQWGLSFVEYYGEEGSFYEPREDGRSLAFIVPVVENGELIDLCAIDGLSQHVGTRLGLGRGLGMDEIEKASLGMFDLRLAARPLDWLRDPIECAYLFKLREVPIALDGVDKIICNTIEFGDRLASFLPPSERSRIEVAL